MLRSLMSGVSGVKGHQTLLDVVGDNISNANTAGFKKSSVNFQELMSQTEKSATAPGAEKGGSNPNQIGLGMSIGSVIVDHSQGNINYTGAKGDIAIEGDGFFVVEQGSNKVYTRAGAFILDGNGDMVQSGTGSRLQGFTMSDDPLNPGNKIVGTSLNDINIPVGQKIPAKATTTAGFRCNLDSRVGTILPMGLSGNDVVFQGTIGNVQYDSITFSKGTGLNDFIRATFTNAAGSQTTVNLPIAGINPTFGLPVLTPTTADLSGPASNDTISFDDTTGQVSVVSSGGTVLWTGDLGAALDYHVVNISDGSGGTLQYLAHFDDIASGGRSLVLTGLNDNATTPAMERVQLDLDADDDGTFIVPAGTTVTLNTGGVTPQTLDVDSTTLGMGIALSQGGTSVKNFDLQTASLHSTKFNIFDGQGNSYTLETSWEKVDNNVWRWRAWLPDTPGVSLGNNTGLLEFHPSGLVDYSSGPSTVTINFASLGAPNSQILLDLTGQAMGVSPTDSVTQFGSAFTTKEYYQDGYRMGVLQDYSVGSDGIIRGIYDNGQTQSLYTLAVAVFSNPSGLEKMGNGAYRDTANSGIPQILKPMEGGAGSLAGKSLEASNVDLTSEFVNLIKAQRGFQASARVITTSDQILEELMNLKR
ncbi:MAG TPA: flagellar hook-basal body complex protein [Thermovirgaceae bacterium]|nr:flagellar hook-basal body complex protein [Thermovirgaceae bacterium]